MKLTNNFKTNLFKELEKFGVSKYNISYVLLYGSSLYVKHYDDYDFKIIVKRRTEHTKNTIETEVCGTKVHFVFYTIEEWNDLLNERDQCVVAECNEMICIYGEKNKLKMYDCINDKEVQEYLITLYDEMLFNCENNDFYLGDKRLWNFLLFAFKFKNKSNHISWYQRLLINRAHDLKLDKEKFRPLFISIKEELL